MLELIVFDRLRDMLHTEEIVTRIDFDVNNYAHAQSSIFTFYGYMSVTDRLYHPRRLAVHISYYRGLRLITKGKL